MTALQELKAAKEDFEWYPTTNEILQRVESSLDLDPYHRGSLLDIGAGNGKVLDFFKGKEIFSSFYAIEKSQTHLSNLNKDYYILGVDFHKTSLYDKDVDTIFSNPPYSEYVEWTCKILEEVSNCVVYLVIPQRWKDNQRIQDVISARKLEVEVKGNFSFENAEDRAARAQVDLLRVRIKRGYGGANPFEKFFNETFSYPIPKKEQPFEERVDQGLTKRKNLIEVLCELYDDRMLKLQQNYTAVCSLDADLLSEFEISRAGLIESLKMKIATAKKEFWGRLFDGMGEITKRLTADSRKKILNLMNDQTGIDFNAENAYAVVLWVIKNANEYFDQQFIDVYETMISYANVDNYKSNERVFTKDQFSYWYRRDSSDPATHYKIKIGNRIVLENSGGLIAHSPFEWKKGLSERAAEFIGDLMTIANNLGYVTSREKPREAEWDGNEAQVFYCLIGSKREVLFRVRAFLNGNMHFQFLPEFVHALNVKFGSLKGWVHAGNAAQETEAPTKIVEKFFDYQFQIGYKQLLLA